jgi:acyl-phosphate glycerol 3-phosphate acyltransferase
MLTNLGFIVLGFISGSIPVTYYLGRLANKDITIIGDGNPGATNLWNTVGWKIGLLGFILDVSKGALPVYLGIEYYFSRVENPNIAIVTLIVVAPVAGIAFSPLLGFKGSKALSVTAGVWIGISAGLAFLIMIPFMGLLQLIQKTHVWTIMISMVGMIICLSLVAPNLPLLIIPVKYLIPIWIVNMVIIIIKHWDAMKTRIEFRGWLYRFVKAEPS